MPAEEFRRFGHEIVDWIANYFEHIEELPVLARVEPGDLKAQLPSSPPEKGESMAAILADVDRLIVPRSRTGVIRHSSLTSPRQLPRQEFSVSC